MPWGQICGSITFYNSEAGSEILNDEYTSGLLDFNFSQEEIDITKGRRYSCSFSASVSGDNLEICKWTFFGILDKVLVAVEEPINGLLRILFFSIGFEGMVGGFL
jgi:hypothetical protein